MAKPKNQTDLVYSYVKGETSGSTGHLLIQGDTLYNTENNEYLPVCRRIGPAGNTKCTILNIGYSVPHHGKYKHHRGMVEEAIYQASKANPKSPFYLKYCQMNIVSNPVDKHPLLKQTITDHIKHDEQMVKKHEDKILLIQAHTYEPGDHEAKSSDAELIEQSRKIADECRTFVKYLKEEGDDVERITQIQDIEELVRAPEIMEQAIKNGGIDPAVLQRMLATRDSVQDIIDNVEKHIAIILSIPDRPA